MALIEQPAAAQQQVAPATDALRQYVLPLLRTPAVFIWYGPRQHHHYHNGVHVDELARQQRQQQQQQLQRRLALRFIRKCSLCKNDIQVDLLRYLPSTSDYRLCRIGCEHSIAIHIDCIQNYLVSFGEERFSERCEDPQCIPITYSARNGLNPKEWPETFAKILWHLLVRHITCGIRWLVPLYLLAFLVGQMQCLYEGHLCTPSQMGLPLASEAQSLIELEQLEGRRMHSVVFFLGVFWLMGACVFLAGEILHWLVMRWLPESMLLAYRRIKNSMIYNFE
jgi:hypothetical protein